jgi:CRISPR-associated endonuclease/helicase Cas3
VSGDDPAGRQAQAAAAFASQARALAAPGRTVGVIVNRVDTARAVYAALAADGGLDVHLLTGRMRPLDREAHEAALLPAVSPGRTRTDEGRPAVLVATQCVEAGADFDLDHLVTECASLDALKQRLGRLNRTGLRDGAWAVVLLRKDHASGEDPVYGLAMANTWAWLQGLGPFDGGPSAMPAPEDPTPLVSPATHAPVLLPAHLDRWVQTSPIPEPDPDLSLWLHGPQREADEVQVVWRGDLDEALLLAAADGGPAADRLRARLTTCPPGSPEALSVPRRAVIAWLSGAAPVEVSDIEGPTSPPEDRRQVSSGLAVRWFGADDLRTGVAPASALRPGDTVLVPSTRGGLRAGTWDPTATDPVPDWGDRVQLLLRGRGLLRLDAGVLQSWGVDDAGPPALPDDAGPAELYEAARAWVAALRGPAWLVDQAGRLMELPPRRLRVTDEGDRLVVHARGQLGAADTTTEASESIYAGGSRLTLDQHLRDVASWAADFAARCGVEALQRDDLVLAARWHDLGKLDPRFQALLHGGDAPAVGEPLAKSIVVAGDAAGRRRARERSRYPAGGRHELLSEAMLVAQGELLAAAHDPDLVLHLVASHHGYARPFVPVAVDAAPVEVGWDGATYSSNHELHRLDQPPPARFWRLVRRYGWHGLAWLEAILRLADHRASEAREAP